MKVGERFLLERMAEMIVRDLWEYVVRDEGDRYLRDEIGLPILVHHEDIVRSAWQFSTGGEYGAIQGQVVTYQDQAGRQGRFQVFVVDADQLVVIKKL